MRIISKRALREYWIQFPDTENQLLSWYKVMETGRYNHSNDILDNFPFSRSIGAARYVFKIKGNHKNFLNLCLLVFHHRMGRRSNLEIGDLEIGRKQECGQGAVPVLVSEVREREEA